jgi:hypothetical protein
MAARSGPKYAKSKFVSDKKIIISSTAGSQASDRAKRTNHARYLVRRKK